MRSSITLAVAFGAALAAGLPHAHPDWHHRHSRSSKSKKVSTASVADSSVIMETAVTTVYTTVDAASVVSSSSSTWGEPFHLDPSTVVATSKASPTSKASSTLKAVVSTPAASKPAASSAAAVAASSAVAKASGGVWQPSTSESFQMILSGVVDVSQPLVPADASVWDIDLFTTPAETIAALKAHGKKVVCYFSAGSYEDGRPDSGDFVAADKGTAMDGWPEWWLDTESANVRKIMKARIETAAAKGCDAVDPDNMDGYQNENGKSLTEATAISYLTYLSTIASTNSLAIGLKNSLDIVDAVKDLIQFGVNEECHLYDECDMYAPLTAVGKPVWNVEYPEDMAADTASTAAVGAAGYGESVYCKSTGLGGFHTLLKTLDLDGSTAKCDGSSVQQALAG